ncbi:unnamed protein product [Lepeophtheirus salmonis]|uniref:(salmon louse) hypothetical protein n=1 Tax=Lepeophtheirus salmonis TaxID=72036 RepID=A0A7R8CB94_LEPSM|nr:unnamed protein product [Lepeophtheirus salmonis]CAF2756048.1 unnamed protein product [Lepeophtheirus salmonis]
MEDSCLFSLQGKSCSLKLSVASQHSQRLASTVRGYAGSMLRKIHSIGASYTHLGILAMLLVLASKESRAGPDPKPGPQDPSEAYPYEDYDGAYGTDYGEYGSYPDTLDEQNPPDENLTPYSGFIR